MSAPVRPSRNPARPRGPRITSHEIVRMRKLVQNGMTSRMMNRPLRLAAARGDEVRERERDEQAQRGPGHREEEAGHERLRPVEDDGVVVEREARRVAAVRAPGAEAVDDDDQDRQDEQRDVPEAGRQQQQRREPTAPPAPPDPLPGAAPDPARPDAGSEIGAGSAAAVIERCPPSASPQRRRQEAARNSAQMSARCLLPLWSVDTDRFASCSSGTYTAGLLTNSGGRSAFASSLQLA